MAVPVTSDPLLKVRAESFRALLNVGHTLKLFASNVVPGPDTPRASFVQPTFAGYSAQSLAGVWGAVTRIDAGRWAFQSRLFTFTRTGGLSQLVYGWWIDNGSSFRLAQRWPVPINTATTLVIPIVLRFEERSLSLCLA